jgi:tetraacyldisaccharide 4'-kinase
VPVISVGNLAVGGTGKTPMVEYLVRLLSVNLKLGMISRGYGRKTKGFRLATAGENASTIGDEPFQIFRKYGDRIQVAVGEERAMAIPYLLNDFEDLQVIILDDAFQHRKVKPSFQIVLSDFAKPFYSDYLLPAGRLREARRGVARANVVIFTKCPYGVSEEIMMEYESKTRLLTGAPVFFSCVRYGSPVSMQAKMPLSKRVVLITGIANASGLKTYVRNHFDLAHHFEFPDHYAYKAADLGKVIEVAKKENASILTTEKDAVKLETAELQNMLKEVSSFYLPIETDFVKNGKEFDEMVINAVTQPVS